MATKAKRSKPIPSKAEIIASAALHGISIPRDHVILDRIQNAYRQVEARGGMDKIVKDIEARIEAARQRAASRV